MFSGWWRPPNALVRRRRFSLVFSNKFCCSANFFSNRGSWLRIDSTCLQSFEPLFFSVHRISEWKWKKQREHLIRINLFSSWLQIKLLCCYFEVDRGVFTGKESVKNKGGSLFFGNIVTSINVYNTIVFLELPQNLTINKFFAHPPSSPPPFAGMQRRQVSTRNQCTQ